MVFALIGTCAIMSSCGGGRPEAMPTERSAQPVARAATTASTPDATHIMDWAESHYPQFFPHHAGDQTGFGYTYRYYPETGNYLGVSGSNVAVLGPISGNAILNVGTTAGFACNVDPVGCGLPDVIAQPQSVGVAPGVNVVFELALSPASPGSIQWQSSTDGAHSFANIAGANSTSLSFNSALGDNGKWVRALVSNAQGTVTTRPARLTVAAATVLAACTEITAPGNYVLSAQLSAAPGNTGACLYIHDTHDVHLDCAAHSITQNGHLNTSASWLGGLLIERVRDFSVRNCVVNDDFPTISSSENGSIAHNTFANDHSQVLVIDIESPTRVQFYANTVVGGVQQLHAFQGTIAANSFTWTPGFDGAGMAISYAGNGTLIASNTMDGSFNGGPWHYAADDGVVVQDEKEPVIQDNVIANVYDTGIEWAGMLDTGKVLRNRISNTGYSGFGGWFWMSSINSQFVANDVTESPTMFQIFRAYALRPIDTGVYFTGNRFEGNVFHSVDTTAIVGHLFVYNYLQYSFGGISVHAGERDATPADFHMAGNVFVNNDFGHSAAGPWFGYGTLVDGLIVDGGGNSCRPLLGFPEPLVCR